MDKEGLEDKQDNQMEENNNDKDKDKTRWTLDHQWQNVMDNEVIGEKTDDKEKHFLEGKEGGR